MTSQQINLGVDVSLNNPMTEIFLLFDKNSFELICIPFILKCSNKFV